MRVTQPAVLVGNYDWSEAQLPKAEYEARIKSVLEKLAGSGVAGLVVYGNKVDNAALAYLTNFTPKIESGIALVAKDGKVRIHGAGSPQMMVNAKRLTWVEDVRPLRDLAKNIGEWAEEAAPGPLGVWATEAMPTDLMPRLQAGLGERKLVDLNATLDPLLREKSPSAQRLVRGACVMLGAASTSLRAAFRAGATAREAAVAAEKSASEKGAQDVRALVSLSKGGTPTAIDYPQSGKLDPLLAYIAVRHAGYWAEGSLTLASAPGATLARTEEALKAMLTKVKAGATTAEIKQAAQEKLQGLEIHPAAAMPVNGIGLSLVEREADPQGVTRLEEGRIYTLRAGVRKPESDNALLSAMIEAKAGQAEILWSSLA